MGFLPGHASFAYFFFLGSWLNSAAAAARGPPCPGITLGGRGAGAISTSGAGFGRARPSREANADEKRSGLLLLAEADIPENTPAQFLTFLTDY
jgi:hypothetical protein